MTNRAQEIVDTIILKAIEVEIQSNVEFDDEQLDALFDLNEYCVNQILHDPEVIRDPRKVFYKASQEMKLALTAIVLTQSLINADRRIFEKKEFFEDNITVSTQKPEVIRDIMRGQSALVQNVPNIKFLSFGEIPAQNVQDAVYWEIINDWKTFRDCSGHGIRTLVDKKTNLTGLNDFKAGGDIIYEFARFQRKYTEKENKKAEIARDKAQDAFRTAMAQTIGSAVANQHLLAGKDPMELMNLLFAPNNPKNQKDLMRIGSSKVEKKVEENIQNLLEYNPPK